MSNLRLINETTASSVATISVTDVFTSDFDIYKITFVGLSDDSGGSHMNFRFVNSSGSVVTTSNYDYAHSEIHSYDTNHAEKKGTNSNAIKEFSYSFSTSLEATGTIYVFNPYSTSSYSFMLQQSEGQFSSGALSYKGIGVLKQTASMTGFNIYPNVAGNINAQKIRTYGLRVDS
jgi:hypothetical protein